MYSNSYSKFIKYSNLNEISKFANFNNLFLLSNIKKITVWFSGIMAKPSHVIVRSEPGGQLLRVVVRVAGGVGTAALDQ